MAEGPIEVRAERLLAELEAAPKAEREARRDEARQLAEAVKSEAIDLCHSRATEHSERIGDLFLAAAKLAYVGYVDEMRPAHFERDIDRDPVAQADYARFIAAVDSGD